jgi:Phage integrase family
MTVSTVFDAAGRRRSPATMPGYHAGRPPRNKGLRYPADPPTVDEIVAVMRHAANDRHGFRLRAVIVVLWRAGLRVQEALALTEHDLDARRGSMLVRNGKGGRRREVGMDEWGWEQLRPWLNVRGRTAGRTAVLHHRRPDPRTTVVRRRRPLGVPPACRPRRRQAPLRAAPAAPRARARARPRGRRAQHHPAPARARQSRHHVDLPARDRPRGDHRHRPDTPRADDVGQRRAAALIATSATMSGSATRAPARLCRSERRHGPTHTTAPRPLR